MKNLAQLVKLIPTSYYPFIFIIISVIIIILFIYYIRLSSKIKQLSEALFSLQRSVNHKETIFENTISKLAQNLPLDNHPATQEKHISNIIEQLLNKFSIQLQRKIQDNFQDEQDIWHDKFTILLTILGKTEQDLRQNRDELFKKSWISITELRQKSQLLFNDMKEDGIFYRMQSLWLLSDLEAQKQFYYDSFRYSIAALKLYQDSKPTLPLSQKIAWKVGENLADISTKLDKQSQQKNLKKFNLTMPQVLEIFQELENTSSNIEVFQKIRLWNNQFTSIL
ncbi:MAG: hypothetical protein KFW21_04555 [Spirochaetota bacterium]|nr:hypothetical protein [Spirochaetota bacterium]